MIRSVGDSLERLPAGGGYFPAAFPPARTGTDAFRAAPAGRKPRERGREGNLCGGFPLSQKAPPGTFPLTFRHGYQETNPFFSLSFSSTIRWLNPVMWTSEQDT